MPNDLAAVRGKWEVGWGAYQNDQRNLRIHPSQINHEDEEAQLRDHPLRQHQSSPNFLKPPLRPLIRNMQLHLPPRHPPLDSLLMVDVLRNRPPVRCPSRLRRDHIDQQKERQQDHDDVKAPARRQVGNDQRPDTKPNAHTPHEAETPDSQPNAYPTALSTHVVVGRDLLVGFVAHQARAEEVEERRQEIDIRESKCDALEGAWDE